MTVEEDIQLLKNRVAQLEAQNAEQQDTIDLWRINGLENLVGGYGVSQVGQSFRFTSEGLQIISPAGAPSTMVAWLSGFVTDLGDVDFPIVSLAGQAASASQEFDLAVQGDADTAATMAMDTTAGTSASTAFSSSTVDTGAGLEIAAGAAAVGAWVKVTDAPLWLPVLDADPAVLADGMMWYRSDLDTFRGRANGATVTFTVS